ncbi:cell division-specific peptidoglycan biosynthesis regulator FtsW [Melghiribacillus thermohalophilus]|uniref:Probable peptidoglycan glycosyltransferase FtsW n=1 Tax=Melghiribacillus thermohalophilus TaxID=1324956 RepID=A0A4R3NBT8_9BACI|nr:putative lipid II flippase FtsW [Melghiribacillus thermohalophilus]TCT26914.1 cell division-specific peptidoglycan biosynthesis regulator FtsW [Melghiribacillus thermohalophilus]
MKKVLQHFDFLLIFSPLVLIGFGTVMIYSASMVYAVVELGVESNYFFVKQLQWFAIGSVMFFFAAIFPYQKYQKFVKIIVLSMLFLLFLVLIIGDSVNNARSWFDLGFFRVQPAEISKLGIILYLSSVYAKKQDYISDFYKAVIPPLLITVLTLGLIIMQPDLGTAVSIFLIAFSIIISSGIRLRHLIFLGAVGALLMVVAIPNMITDERIGRFVGAYEPFSDPDDDGYQLIQSYIAFGTGGLSGTGLGQSVQKLGYLPEAHTDFIMAVVAEELGVIGVSAVLSLLALIVLRGLYFARKCRNQFGKLLAIGISSMVGMQTFINVGAISGLLPITGVTLPLVSYGGSSLLIVMISLGILNNIAFQIKKEEDQGTKERKPLPESQSYSKEVVHLQKRGGQSWAK